MRKETHKTHKSLYLKKTQYCCSNFNEFFSQNLSQKRVYLQVTAAKKWGKFRHLLTLETLRNPLWISIFTT